MTEPITPKQALAQVDTTIPDGVFEAFNELIVKHLRNGVATFKQKDVAKLIAKKTGESQRDIFDNGWLDVEESYRKMGWKVSYDKPGLHETYEPTFEFSVK